MPRGPGVYLFRDASQRVLYVGKSVDLRARVRQYFTAAESRRRMAEMVAAAEEVVPLPCATALEAEVRELRLIAEYKPPYNRRSRFPEKVSYLKLTLDSFPRLSVVREAKDDGSSYLGPFASRRAADAVRDALHETFPLRQCTHRLSTRRLTTACILAEMGRCGAPCEGRQTPEEYQSVVVGVRAAMQDDARPVVDALTRRMRPLVAQQRFEDAVTHRDRLLALLAVSARAQRLRALGRVSELVAARPKATGGWEVAVIRHGRLAASGVAEPGVAPQPFVAALRSGADTVPCGSAELPNASVEEAECLLRWLDAGGTRLVDIDGTWASPRHGSAGLESRVGLAPVPPRGDLP